MNEFGKGLLTKVVVDKISKKIGIENSQAKSAMESLIPTILGGLAKNSEKEEQAKVLADVITKDHDGSILDNLDGFLDNVKAAKGDKIIGHIFGKKSETIGKQVSEKVGLDKEQSTNMLEILGPLVMGSIGKETKKTLETTSGDLISGILKDSIRDFDYKKIAISFLDKDGDGDVKDDLIEMGKNYLKKFMS